MKNEPRKHHWMTKGYMRPWLGSDNLVQRFYRPHVKVISRRHAPSGFAWEEDLYRLHLPNATSPVEVEQEIGRIEDAALPVRDKIVASGVDGLTSIERAQFSLFLALLLIRRPEQVRPRIEPVQKEWEASMLQAVAESLTKGKLSKEKEAVLLRACEGFGSALVLHAMMDEAKSWAGRIAALDWRSFDLSSACLPILLSDDPIRMWGDGHGKLRKITIPLSPYCVFVGGVGQPRTEIRYQEQFRDILALEFIGDQFRSARHFVIGLNNGADNVLLRMADENWGKDTGSSPLVQCLSV